MSPAQPWASSPACWLGLKKAGHIPSYVSHNTGKTWRRFEKVPIAHSTYVHKMGGKLPKKLEYNFLRLPARGRRTSKQRMRDAQFKAKSQGESIMESESTWERRRGPYLVSRWHSGGSCPDALGRSNGARGCRGDMAMGPGRGGIWPRLRRTRGAGQSARPVFVPGCHGTSHSPSTTGPGETGAGNGWQRFPDGDFKLTEHKRVQFWWIIATFVHIWVLPMNFNPMSNHIEHST